MDSILGALYVVIGKVNSRLYLPLDLLNLPQLELIALVSHFTKSLIKTKLKISVKNTSKSSSHSFVSLPALFKPCDRIFDQVNDLFGVVPLSPVLDFLLVNFLSFVELKQKQEDDFKFFAHHCINSFQSFFDVPTFVPVSQKLVEIFVLNLLLSANQPL